MPTKLTLAQLHHLIPPTLQHPTTQFQIARRIWPNVNRMGSACQLCHAGEMALLLFGINLVYKLRNASSEAHKEKLVLSAAVFIELFVSALTYTARHFLWNQLSTNQILLLYCFRCQLTVSVTLGLVFGPKVSGRFRLRHRLA